MRQFALAAFAALCITSSTGCSALRSVLCQPWQPCYSWSQCGDGGCSDCGDCGGCADGGCGAMGGCTDGSCGSGGGCADGSCGLGSRLLAHKRAKHAVDPNAGLVQGAGAVTYPYYTTRGPRDFLACNPGNIGR